MEIIVQFSNQKQSQGTNQTGKDVYERKIGLGLKSESENQKMNGYTYQKKQNVSACFFELGHLLILFNCCKIMYKETPKPTKVPINVK